MSITNSITYHNDSLTLYNEFASPLDQFVKVLTKKKLAKIDQSPIRDVMNRMFVIKITLINVDEKLFYRIVELPASTSLAILHDKIISAVVGWCRGYHGYVFIDSSDGTVLGPAKNDGYIDMMHSKFHYHNVGDDRKFPLASLIKAVGEICEYVYDLGDQFRHKIELIEIKDETYRPVRNVTILDGKTSCPPEDSNGLSKNNGGNYDFNDLLKKYVSNPNSCAKQIRKIESSAVNYTSHWLTGQPIKFEALKYDVVFHQHVLDRMIEGPNVTLRNIGEFVETYHACNYCGESLKSLQKCSACNMTYYCSKDCQKKDWVDGHKEECKELKAFSS